MIINILGKFIDTKNIVSINDIESNKKGSDINREAGFIVILKDDFLFRSYQSFKENIPAEASLNEVKMIKGKWLKLQKKICEKWNQDKMKIEYFGFETKLVHLCSGKTGVLVKEFSNYYGEAIMIKLDDGKEYFAPKREFKYIT